MPATDPILDIGRFLTPIDGDHPSGPSLAYEPEYDRLREARRADDDTPQGDWQRDTKNAAWDEVIELASDCLERRSKDLQIAAWLTEALAHLHQFAGARDGLALMRALVESFWDTLHPEIEDGDLGWRASPIDFLNTDKVLPLLIRSMPLTDVWGEKRYSFLRWEESRATDNAGRKNPEALEALIAEGKITGEQFDEAVQQTPRKFYEALVADVIGAQEALKSLEAALDARFGRNGPSVSSIRKALDDVRRTVEPVLKRKRQDEPDAEEESAAESESEPESGTETVETDESEVFDDDLVEPEREETPAAVPRRKVKAARSASGPIASADDARERAIEAADYLRRNEPSSPAGHLITRALRMAELYGLGNPPESSGLAAPSSTVRQTLKKLAAEGDWSAVLDQAEAALGRPEGRAWLDAHRYAAQAMANASDVDRATTLAASKALLRALLADYPDLARAELCDDTPTANAETRAWIEAEVVAQTGPSNGDLPAPAPVAVPEPATHAASEGAEGPDVWVLAVADVKSGRAGEGLQRLRRAVAQATSGRERFRRKLQMAELCLMAKSPRAALPLLEELARQVDEFRLEQWEDEELCARVWGALYRCLRGLGAENGPAERLQQVYDRLCRLDINLALSYANA